MAAIKYVCVLTLVLFSAGSVVANAEKNLAHQVYQMSGIEEMVKRFPEMLKEGVSANVSEKQRKKDPFVQQLTTIIDAEIDPASLGAKIQQHLANGLEDKQLKSVMNWFQSETGKKVVSLERSAITVKSVREMESQVVALQRKYKGSEREKLFSQFDKATNMTEASLETAMAVQVALAGAFSGADESNPASFEQLQQVVEANRFMTRGLIGQHVYTNYLYTYQTLSIDEIKQYIAFAESSDGKRYYEVLNAAFRSVLIEPSRKIGRSIMRAAIEAS